jgi:hypothetical protein
VAITLAFFILIGGDRSTPRKVNGWKKSANDIKGIKGLYTKCISIVILYILKKLKNINS